MTNCGGGQEEDIWQLFSGRSCAGMGMGKGVGMGAVWRCAGVEGKQLLPGPRQQASADTAQHHSLPPAISQHGQP